MKCNEWCLSCHVGQHDLCRRPELCQCDGIRDNEREVEP